MIQVCPRHRHHGEICGFSDAYIQVIFGPFLLYDLVFGSATISHASVIPQKQTTKKNFVVTGLQVVSP